MDYIFDKYSSMVRKLTDYVRKNSDVSEKERDLAWKGATRAQACDAVRPVLPVATKSTVGIFASGQAIESLIMHLQSDELEEARIVGDSLLREARKVIPMYLERADKPERGGAMVAYRANTNKSLKSLAKENLPDSHSSLSTEDITLVDFWPKNELLLVADMLYEYSNLSLDELQTAINAWPYDQKLQVFKAYMGERLNRRHKPGRALEKAHYSWDILCDYGIFRDLQRHRMVDDLAWQQLTPRYGYEIPKLIEEANLVEEFEECFEVSLRLYSDLQKAGYPLEAQYATLLGHKMRWKITYNAREAFHLHELRTSPQGHPGYRKLVGKMHEKLAEVHPLIAESMIFVNKDEDPKLTRLAAERYTQFKLKKV
jgi:thymidylate synthase ThyX